MNTRLRNGLLIAFGIIVAVAAGWQIAHESYFLVGAFGGALALWLMSRAFAVPVDALVAGLVLAGYLIGNRGFAQLSVPGLPLLPGEIALGVGLFVALWMGARNKMLPVRRDALNFTLLAWLVFGAIRLWPDMRIHGFKALRDFAICYYALFFFLAQGWWTEPEKRRWIERCLTVGFALGAPVLLAFARWPEVFVKYFSVFGMPMIYIKSDVQAGLLIAGTFWFVHRYVAFRRTGWLVLAAAALLGVGLANSRAALVAFTVACLWVVARRDWRTLQPIVALASIGFVVLLAAPLATGSPWKQGLAYRYYESAASIVDVRGARVYEADDLGDKADNNLFRLTWWRIVIEETWTAGRWFGLGFGYDLSGQFVRVYYADSAEEFSARSPHNFPLTVFARTGMIGFGLLLMFLIGMSVRTWRAGQIAAQATAPSPCFAMWVGAWGIFVSACFGVVLEGPMGAVVFWTLLGLANASSQDSSSLLGEPDAGEAADPAIEDATSAPAGAASS